MKSKRRTTASASFVFVSCACDNILIEAKLEIFVALTKPLQEFLLKFQTEAPMTLFLVLFLKDLFLATMGHFLKNEVLEKADALRSYLLLTLLTKRTKKTQSMLTLALLFEVL